MNNQKRAMDIVLRFQGDISCHAAANLAEAISQELYQAERRALEEAKKRLDECATCIEKHSYPTPDKEDTPWAVARRARNFLNRDKSNG